MQNKSKTYARNMQNKLYRCVQYPEMCKNKHIKNLQEIGVKFSENIWDNVLNMREMCGKIEEKNMQKIWKKAKIWKIGKNLDKIWKHMEKYDKNDKKYAKNMPIWFADTVL